MAQDVQVSRENKTDSKDIAYEDNGRVAARIIGALLGAGVKKEDIETEVIQLGKVEEDYTNTPRQRSKDQQFQSQQPWSISVPVSEVQKVVDIAVLAGVNDVQEVIWAVKNPDAVEREL